MTTQHEHGEHGNSESSAAVRKARATTSTLLAAVLLLLAAPYGCGTPEQPSEQIAESQQAIAGGTPDAANYMPYVVAITLADQTFPFCSGTLVAPRWVMTAAHCFKNNPVNGSYDVVLAYDPSTVGAYNPSSPDFLRFQHTPGNNGNVILRDPTPTTPQSSLEERGRDIALFRLDQPVPSWRAQPVTLPQAGDCPPPAWYHGTIVGYGLSYDSQTIDPEGTCDDGLGRVRRSVGVDPWIHQVLSSGSVYTYTTVFPIATPCALDGIVGGDSGGPLFDWSTVPPRQCGVGSGDTWLIWGSPPSMWSYTSIYAGVDSPETVSFLASAVTSTGQAFLELNGNPEGVCSPTEADRDGDGVPNRCDDCPNVYNPEQLSPGGDDDFDGVGNACDLCDNQADGDVSYNRNIESEYAELTWSLANEVGTVPPDWAIDNMVLRLSDFPSLLHLLSAIEKLKQHVQPDWCDDDSVPRHSLTENGQLANLPAWQLSDCWGLYGPTATCQYRVRNRLELDAYPSGAVMAYPGTVQTEAGFRWCSCPESVGDSDTMSGRQECAKNPNKLCIHKGDAFNSSAKWIPIDTQSGFDHLWALDVAVQPNTAQEVTTWDFRTLPDSISMGPFGERREGVLWSHMLYLEPMVPASMPAADVPKYANHYSGGDPMYYLDASVKNWMWPNLELSCLDCPYFSSNWIASAINPADIFAVNQGGKQAAPALTEATQALVSDIIAGNLELITAGESLGTLDKHGKDEFTDSVAVDQEGNVTSYTTRASPGDPPEAQDLPIETGASVAANRGMALSGVEEYLFIFGGTEDGSPSGEASNTAVRVNLDTREAGEMVFGEGENLPGHVEAARWRHQDRAVYFVTRTEENLELKKWEAMRNFAAAGAIQTLATFPSEWAELDDVSMDIAADGAILVSMDNGEFLRLAWFNTDLGSPLRYYGTYVAESMPLARSPMATPLGVVVFPEQDEPTLLSVPWSSFVVEGEQPVIH